MATVISVAFYSAQGGRLVELIQQLHDVDVAVRWRLRLVSIVPQYMYYGSCFDA